MTFHWNVLSNSLRNVEEFDMSVSALQNIQCGGPLEDTKSKTETGASPLSLASVIFLVFSVFVASVAHFMAATRGQPVTSDVPGDTALCLTKCATFKSTLNFTLNALWSEIIFGKISKRRNVVQSVFSCVFYRWSDTFYIFLLPISEWNRDHRRAFLHCLQLNLAAYHYAHTLCSPEVSSV